MLIKKEKEIKIEKETSSKPIKLNFKSTIFHPDFIRDSLS